MQLKTILREWQNEKGDLDNLEEVIKEMLINIGSVDEELRDSLIYSTFYQLIENNKLSNSLMVKILDVCLSEEYLFKGIGEQDTDTVFTRSFSSLVIALIVEKDKTKEFLDKQQLEEVYKKTTTYLQSEKDVRGYVEGKGWAHSIAHGADLFESIISHPSNDILHAEEWLNVIKACIWRDTVLQDDEDERLIFAVEAMIEKGLPEEMLVEWVHNFESLLEAKLKEQNRIVFYKYRSNVMNFLKSLYFRLTYLDQNIHTQHQIKKTLKNLHEAMYKRE
ncbi:DUF2785 domain-containing protein [Psychrobacillus sp. BL-248-WT-3]|uniref:DUF2785 domain-containing protein n=1 Tax=Psychrobacillus sp. BL-248-WT-3 TaxID=2725306 RepID=UPI00146E2625|nr:DUF2785 domain-containing protein [Psychrobacillus sp. BL-248-WT-3]NME04415.1 DUF2785 domain-containing protein [Psychrobacillus sp. BL-248-WT-3]